MVDLLTNIGEEHLVKTDFSGGVSFTVLLYNDTTDTAADATDVGGLTTEPSDGNYARQSETFTAADISGNWGYDNDTSITFDVTSTTGSIDAYGLLASFTSTEAGDGSPTTHLIGVKSLSQSYDLSNLTSLTINAGNCGVTVD